ncbi:MAG: transcription termination/antitermination protein NusG [Bacillota bacterium]
MTASGENAETSEPRKEREPGEWYVIHTYSGQENSVRERLLKRVESMGLDDQIYDVLVPTDERIQVKDGKRTTVEERVFPGYALVRMRMTEESWHAVRYTPGVTGFVSSGTTPVPLEDAEVEAIQNRMAEEKPRPKIDLEIGENIRVVSGPFDGFMGTVNEIDARQGKVHVMVNMFGRETPVELDFTQVEKV